MASLHMLFVVFGILGVQETFCKVSCIGKDGKPVDMWIIYKLPKVTTKSGMKYLYLDSNKKKFELSKKNVCCSGGVPEMTLKQVYQEYKPQDKYERSKKGIYVNGSQTVAHVFYNDGVPLPSTYSFAYGHTKGEIAFDKESGFWLISSVPKFPVRTTEGKYKYPHSGFKYGQMMMCVSFAAQSFEDIAVQLQFSKPNIFDGNLPSSWRETHPQVYNVLKGKYVASKPFSHIANLKSSAGVEFTHFSKAKGFGHDLYHNLVAPTLKTNLIVESWQHGTHNIGPSCKGNYTVVDMRSVEIKVAGGATYSFKTFQDHSKFAIGEMNYSPYVCVGDINRQFTQYHRGGGTMCVKDIALWEQFKSLVHSADSCDA